MLTIKVRIRNHTDYVYKWVNWHIGEAPPQVSCFNVVEAQADCDELHYTLTCCAFRTSTDPASLCSYSLPVHVNRNVQRWFGDHAKWIAANIVGCK